MLFTGQISFDIALTNVETTLKRRWDNIISTSKQDWNDVAQNWKMVASALCNVDLTLFQRWTPTLCLCCATFENRFRILLYFQQRINVLSVVICDVETMLIRLWNVSWVVSMKKLILRNILPLLTKLNFYVLITLKHS